MDARHQVIDQEEYRSFWNYWDHGYSCERCHLQLCKTGQQLRIFWKEALDVLTSYEDGKLKWLAKITI